MTAAACLQVVITSNRTGSRQSDMLPTITKVTNSFLESRWSWPRRFSQVTAVSYLLSDPRTFSLNLNEIQALSVELQLRLFGAGGSGDVHLALFQGSPDDATRFSNLRGDELQRVLSPETAETMGLNGRIMKICPDHIEVMKNLGVVDGAGDLDIFDDFFFEPHAEHRPRLLYRPLYLLPKQQFVGNITSRWSTKDKELQSILEGSGHYPKDSEAFDVETIECLAKAYPNPTKVPGSICVPLNYTGLARRSSFDRYKGHLAALAHLPKELLVAAIYETPRTPHHHVLTDIRTLCAPYFSGIDLIVADPDIAVETIERGLIRSITLALGSAEEAMRESAIRRFMGRRDHFRDRRIWPAIGHVRTRHELKVCHAAQAPFVYGPAITGILEQPVGVLPFMASGLPMTAEPR